MRGPQDPAYIPKEEAEAQARAAVAAARHQLARSTRRRLTLLGALTMLLGAAAAGTGIWMVTRPGPTLVTRFVIPSTGATALSVQDADRHLAITPDGTRLVYRSTSQLLVRALDRIDPTVLGSFGAARGVFVSPDGQWVGFVDGAGRSPLKKVAITGGPAVTLTTTDGASRGAAWGEDGTIVYATSSGATGLQRVSSAGGAPTVLTKPDRERGEVDHFWPEFLPGGQALLFTITAATGGPDNAQVAVLDLRTGTYTTVLRGGHHAHYVPTGHLVYGVAGALLGVPFDLGRREVTGPPVRILEGVMTSQNGGIDMAITTTGTLAYVAGLGAAGAQLSLVWVDRMGREEPLTTPMRGYQYARIAPDGTRVALDIRDQDYDIWILDFARQTLTRFTFDPSLDMYPVWAPDSRRIVFASDRAGSQNLYSQAADGTGAVERLTESASPHFPYGITPHGDALVLREDTPQRSSDLLRLPLAAGPSGLSRAGSRDAGALQPLVQSTFAELNAEVAPDGRWLAYQSNESGRDEIYVRPFPNAAAGRWQLSTGGGRTPLWARTGREQGAVPPQIVVVYNWFEELKRLVPTN